MGSYPAMKKGSITARIFGGLGNQMFIYSNARAIALRNNVPLYLDTVSGFRNDPYQREWSLQHFNIQFCQASRADMFDFAGGKIARRLIKMGNNAGLLHNYLVEPDGTRFHPDVNSFQISGKKWIEGYWQSPQYFEDVAEFIRSDFQLKTPLSAEASKMLAQIGDTNAVCLHARRLRNILVGEETSKIKSLTLEYYQKSIQMIGGQVKNPHFFCFSDVPEWLEQNLKIPFPHTMVVFNQGRDDRNYEDFALMCACKHFVISNSTYAWWAAWLGHHPDKTVLTPRPAFWDNQDILPPIWIHI